MLIVFGGGQGAGLVQGRGADGIQRVIDQGRLARAGDAGDAGKETAGYVHRDALQVVAGGADQADDLVRRHRGCAIPGR